MNITEYVNQIKQVVKAAKHEGQFVIYDRVLPTIDVNGEYFFQEHEAEDLLKSVKSKKPADISTEDFILYLSQNW